MPTYYCDTCRKTLQRHEQRHNKERISSTRGVVVGQLNNLPGHPLIGIPIRNEQEIIVVRCVTCGSDARVSYTVAEQQQKSKDDTEVLMFCIFIFLGIPAIIIAIILTLISIFG